jgi:hypothetical protein
MLDLPRFNAMARRSNKKYKEIIDDVLSEKVALESPTTELEVLHFYIKHCYNWSSYKDLDISLFSTQLSRAVFQFVEKNASEKLYMSVSKIQEYFPDLKFSEFDPTFETNDAIDYLTDLSVRRQIKDCCISTLSALSCGDELRSVEEILFTKRIEIAKSKIDKESDYSLEDFRKYLTRLDSKEPLTHYENLDDFLKCALDAYIVIAARPAQGKTALALNILKNMAENNEESRGINLFFSLEMTEDQLYQRLLSIVTGYDMKTITKIATDITREDMKVAYKKIFIDYKKHFKIYHSSSASILDIELKVRTLSQSKHKINCIIVDYFQIIQNNLDFKDDLQKYTDVSKRLKRIVQDYKIPLIVLTQMNREVERRTDKKPLKSDLKGCGAIEENADVIIMLDTPDPDSNRVDLVIVKNKFGATGVAAMIYDKSLQRFTTHPNPQKKAVEKPMQRPPKIVERT